MSSAQDDMDRRGHREAPEWARAKKWDVDFSKDDYEPPTPLPNPLAVGVFCPTCDTRLQVRGETTTPCPICPPEDAA